MKTRTLHHPLMLAMLLVTGCADGKTPDDMVIREKVAPVHAWRLTADLREVPGTPTNVQAYASYNNVWSGEVCFSPRMVRWEIRMPRPTTAVALKEVEPGLYEGVFHLDHFQDEAYFERGSCAWRLNTVDISFEGPGGRVFGAGLGYSDITSRNTSPEVTDYYYADEWAAPVGEHGIRAAHMVPRNDAKADPAKMSDRTQVFPITVRAQPMEGAPGLGVREEFKARTGQDIE